jgi:pimeloyl-ACP methyl ester carboxylesterase
MPSRLRPRSTDRSSINSGSAFPGTEGQGELHPGSSSYDTLGLHLIYDYSSPSGDIIFVHGLGGTATRTWCWNRDLENFWPIWLPDEEGLSSYRIFTFGYNSNFRGSGTKLNLTDFAKELLLQMLTFSGGPEDSEVPIGHRPIIFVAHSMGGLVVKKACVLGRYDREFASIVSQVYGIIFLSTPHRGAQYAKILNNVLSIAPIGAPPKAYIADLEMLSGALQDINEQFRTICGEFALVSFFETLKTSCGVAKMIVRE